MRREIPLSAQVFSHLFIYRDEAADPSNWAEHVRKNLVPELRHEVHMFYGDLLAHTVEARFPGLDYTLRNHRQRLRRFPHHRHLFDAFDELRLTDNEIYRLCDWEGTLWVKRKYEATRGPIRETAGDYIFGGRSSRAARAKLAEKLAEEEEEEQQEQEEGEDMTAAVEAAQNELEQAQADADMNPAVDVEPEDDVVVEDELSLHRIRAIYEPPGSHLPTAVRSSHAALTTYAAPVAPVAPQAAPASSNITPTTAGYRAQLRPPRRTASRLEAARAAA